MVAKGVAMVEEARVVGAAEATAMVAGETGVARLLYYYYHHHYYYYHHYYQYYYHYYHHYYHHYHYYNHHYCHYAFALGTSSGAASGTVEASASDAPRPTLAAELDRL